MEETIQLFGSQLSYEPVIENMGNFKLRSRVILCGMGGSALAAGLIKVFDPLIPLKTYRGYDLASFSDEELQISTVIASSFSGNTEETLSCLDRAIKARASVVAVGASGVLLDRARFLKLPHIVIPGNGLEPRMALGLFTCAVLKILEKKDALAELKEWSRSFDPHNLRKEGEKIAEFLSGYVPVVYSSDKNGPLGYVWKVSFNETSKIPSFCNVFPELNHNEMTSFDVVPNTVPLSKNTAFLFLIDENDDERIKKRMLISKEIYNELGFNVLEIVLPRSYVWDKIFTSTILSYWTALLLARNYGTKPEGVPLV